MSMLSRMLAIVVLALVAPGVMAEQDDFQAILATADGEHAWLVAPNLEVQEDAERPSQMVCRVLHFSREAGPTTARAVVSLPRWPVAIASSGDRLWMVFAPQDARRSFRDVASFRVKWNPALKAYYPIPVGRLEVLSSLPRTARLGGIVSAEDTLAAVVFASRAIESAEPPAAEADDSTASESSAQPTAASPSLVPEHAESPPNLLRLDLTNWSRLSTPGELGATDSVRLGNADVDGERGLSLGFADADGNTLLAIARIRPTNVESTSAVVERVAEESAAVVGEPPEKPAEESAAQEPRQPRQVGPAWSVLPLDVPIDQLHTTLRLGSGTLVVHGRGTINLDYLRPGGELIRLTSLPEPTDPWVMASLGDGPVLFERRADTFKVTMISPLGGDVGEPMDVVEQPASIDWMYMPVTLILIVLVLLTVPLLRPFIESAPVDPAEDLRPMPLFARAAALVIDFIPGAVIAVIIFPVSPADLFDAFRVFELTSGPPALVAIVVTGVQSTLVEVFFGRSVGKMIVGGSVASLDDSRPLRLQLIIRGLVKTVVLMAPLVALLVLLDPLSRGLPELISRTVVVSRRGSGSTPPASDPPSDEASRSE